ncbi:unnamed protein product (macronuclear) [Paramecium tetraurelia]|uniref:Uncharacterized protein n=1 Tax=Paramecium tetraurelia TaxID=5888 RepID=A0DHN2_PARTE|nr:uncharacterized protein GSPATT00016936001 [Paramecium tetraurelia]CAK82549.1 unnamed protein product [Paramecium tetraurelia]|eukprot:XP_001449946.1 hypothetical protein (macronuclear) [Paramecium tetraurelia strain d4-2]
MQSYLQKQDSNRRQSFTFDMEGQNIYYYSVAKPLPNDIIDDLIVCSKIKKLLLSQLPKVWFIMAKTTAYLTIDNQQKFVTSNFILDIFVYSWLSKELQDLKQQLLNRMSKLNIEMEKFHRLIDIFSQEMTFIQKELVQTNTWEYQLNYNKNCIKPLFVFREKCPLEHLCLIKRIDELNIDDDSKNSTLTSSQNSQNSYQKEISRSKTDTKEITAIVLSNKMRKFSKQMEKMSENFFQELITFNSQEQQWQIAGQFVVIIIETTVQSDFDMKTIEKVRFIQPAVLFYKKAIQIWMLTKQSHFDKNLNQHSRIGKVSFSHFLCKAKCFLSQYWKETLTIPLHTFFQLAEQLYPQVENESVMIKKMSTFSILLKEKIVSLWEQNLSLFAKSHIQN